MEASVATPGQGAPPAGTAPAGSQGAAGQGQPTAAGKGDAGAFNWGLFPDVPEEQRSLLEPHLRGVQGHVTKLESQYAPYKGVLDIVGPDQVENLVGFLNQYGSSPVETVLGLMQDLRDQGQITPEQLQAVGLSVAQQQQGAPPAGQAAQPTGDEMPEWAQQMQAKLDQYEQRDQQEAAARAESENQEVLQSAKTNIRGQLTQGGIGETEVSDEMIVAAIIAHEGDEQAAANSIVQMRQNMLAAFTNDKTGGAKQPQVNGELPQPAKTSGRPDRDGFGKAKAGAADYLARANAASAAE